MWSFKRKGKKMEPKEDWRKKAYEKVMAFRQVGEKFHYLGVEMIVTGHSDIVATPFGVLKNPCIKADYVDKHGKIRQIRFDPGKLKGLISENP